MTKHLWEINHPYYCKESSYYASGHEQPFLRFDNWEDFMAEFGDDDFDHNMLFRFDWFEDEKGGATPFNGDPNFRNGRLVLFWMQQRRGNYAWSEVAVCRADEPAVLEFLRPRWEYLKQMWEPLA